MGAPLVYPPPPTNPSIPPPTALLQALELLCCPSGRVLCAHLPPPSSPSSTTSFTVEPQKGHQQMGGRVVTQHQRRGDRGLFSCGYMVCLLLIEVLILVFCHMVLVSYTCTHKSLSPSLSLAHQGENNSKHSVRLILPSQI